MSSIPANESHISSYPRFLGRSLWLATEGSFGFYAWMTMLTAIFLVGANAWANQVAGGMLGTNMTDQVSWGLYIANFTFMVGLAAGGVMMVIPAYLYHDQKMHDVVIVGELLAIAAIVMCLMFVVADLGTHPQPRLVRAICDDLNRVGDLDSHGHGVSLLRIGRSPILEHSAVGTAVPYVRICFRARVHHCFDGHYQTLVGDHGARPTYRDADQNCPRHDLDQPLDGNLGTFH
ncbi:Polysulfide reductase, NrfD [Allorhodopirellula heiligendammensis]|uniref:Polysulfide reductase, NrfD n=1 Tax=Allorhodopirellula heiligendammensis TaxID=2714739 RepID=A0A5C6BSR4_9BACT|nr:Polysulfide reductase, NrfD [Allorhodopirellula heiligendammensis]